MTITRQAGIRLKLDGKAEIKSGMAEIGQSGQQAGAAVEGAFVAANAAATASEKAAERQMARWKEMAKAAREVQNQQAQQAKFNAIYGIGNDGKPAADSAAVFAASNVGMSRGQRAGRLNLARQGADIFTTGLMGMDPAMIAIQQGPQIIDALATSGFKASASMIGVTAAVAGVAVAVGTVTAAGLAYEAQVIKMEVATRGLGASSGVSAGMLDAAARSAAAAGDISARAARDIGVSYVETGRIGAGVLGDLITLTQSYALTTRQDAQAATKELGAAFANPARGVADLNDKLHFLDAAEQRHIENLARSGREAEAQALMVDRLKGSLLDASSATSSWSRQLKEMGTTASNVFDKVGQVVARIVGGGSAIDQLSRLRTRRSNLELGKAFGISSQAQIDEVNQQISALQRGFVAEMDGLRRSAQNQRSTDRQALIDQYNPNEAKLRGLRADREKLMGLGANDPESKKALKELDDQIKALGAGYKSAAQQAAALARQNRAVARDARADAREAEQAARKAADLEVQRLRSAVELAKAKGDPSAIDIAERELRVRELIVQLERDGLAATKAKAEATRQVSAEMVGEWEALKRQLGDRELAKDGFMSSEDRMARVMPGKDMIPYNAKVAFLESFRVESGEAFHDGLMAGMTGGSLWQVFRERMRYASASGLADAVTNGLFGKKDGSGKSGLISAAFNWLAGRPKHAKGTRNAPGGLSWVGEEGAELLEIPRGSKVYNHAESMALEAAHQRAVSQARAATAQSVSSGGITVSATYAPVYNISGGSTEEVMAKIEAQRAQDQASFAMRVAQAVNDGLARRVIRGDQ